MELEVHNKFWHAWVMSHDHFYSSCHANHMVLNLNPFSWMDIFLFCQKLRKNARNTNHGHVTIGCFNQSWILAGCQASHSGHVDTWSEWGQCHIFKARSALRKVPFPMLLYLWMVIKCLSVSWGLPLICICYIQIHISDSCNRFVHTACLNLCAYTPCLKYKYILKNCINSQLVLLLNMLHLD